MGGGLWSRQRRALTLGLTLTITLVAFEALAISTIMPIVARDLDHLDLYGWVFSAFFLGSLIGIVVLGGLIDQAGPARPFAIGLGLFGLGLTLGALASTMNVLVGARFIQGLGGGSIAPIAYVAIGRGLPAGLRPRMFAMLSTAWIVPGIVGPALSGAVAEHLGWRLVLVGLLPLIGVAATLTLPSLAALPPGTEPAVPSDPLLTPPAPSRRLRHALILALGSAVALAGLSLGAGLSSVGLAGLGLALGVPSFLRLTPPGTVRAASGLPATVLLRGLLTFAFFGVETYVPLALVDLRGLSPSAAGIVLTAGTLTWTVGAWAQARWIHGLGAPWFIRTGFATVTVGLLATSLILLPAVSPYVSIVTVGLCGLGMGLSYSPLALVVLALAPAREAGAATSALTLSDVLGTALGTGVSGAIVAFGARMGGGPSLGLGAAFGVAVTVAFGGLLLTGRTKSAERTHVTSA